MQRNYLRGLLLCLIPCLLAAVYAVRLDKYKLGIDLAGGTILVYEINLERTKQLSEIQSGSTAGAAAASPGLDPEDMGKLAAQIKRRIDPADLKNVTVRPLGRTRVEIILPTGGSGGSRSNLTTEEIEEVKRLVSQMGVLEFRILANETDDEVGVRAAREKITATPAADLDALAVQGYPPPRPEEEYSVVINDIAGKVRYAWVELSKEERESLHVRNEDESSELWRELFGNRNKVVTRTMPAGGGDGDRNGVATIILFSRDTKSTVQLDKEEKERKRLEADGKLDQFNAKKVEYFVLTRISPVDQVKIGGDIGLVATADQDRSLNPAIGFQLTGSGTQLFGKMTERNKPTGQTFRNLGVILDEQVISAPTLNSSLPGRGQITGPSGRGLEQKYVNRIVSLLRSGSLNAQLREKPVSENTIGPTLGADTIRKGTVAVGLAFVAVLVFMLGYYRFAGMVACVALLANLLLTVGFMVAVNAAFTLPGLAGIVLMLGMAVDANVLIYERLREERNKGANLATAIRNGYDRAFGTIIDTHLTSIFTSIVLYTFGNDQLKGFAISLTVGLVISLFTSLYMTRLLFDFWLHKRWLTELRMMRLFDRPNFNPMKYRFFFFTVTSVLTVLGLGLFLARGEAGLNVDFRGGTVYGGKLRAGEERAMNAVDGQPGLRDLLGDQAQRDRLKVESARWVNRPASGDLGSVGTYVYQIAYADGATSTVSLTEKPVGADEAAMDRDVAARAGHLPDVSVEQIFLSGESYPQGKSRYFTVRTTERQRDLVQVNLDRLLRDDKGDPLMDRTRMTVGPVVGPVVELRFDKPTSPSYTKDLLQLEFAGQNAVEGRDFAFELTGVGPEEDGRFTTMRLDVSKNPRLAGLSGLAAAASAGGPGGLAALGGPAAVAAATAPADPVAASQLQALQSILTKTQQEFERRPVPERLEVFDSTLAAETRTKAFYAIVASWIAILLYLWFRFGNWTFGLAAVFCLVHDLCFTLGAIAVCHYLSAVPGVSFLGIEDFKIDLATVAALLTLVGYSVNEIIVNFARLREVRGKNPQLTPQMINDSVNQTLSRTILTSMTVFLVSIVLYAFGGEGVHLFAFVMVMGVMVSTYSSIFVASPLLLFLGEGRGPAEPAETAPTLEEEAVVEG